MGGTNDQKDNPGGTGDTSAGQKGTSTPGTFTKETQDKAVSDALSAAGRDAKSVTKQSEANKAEATRLATERSELEAGREKARRADEEKEIEKAKDNPDLLDAYKLKHSLNARETELNKRETDLNQKVKDNEEKVAAADATKREITIWGVARKYTLDASVLKTKVDELNLTTDEQFESLAKAMSEGKDTTGLHGDTGKTTGSGEKSKEQKLKEMYPTMYK